MSIQVIRSDLDDRPRPLRVLVAAPEVAPYSKSGGLGADVQAFTRALAQIGVDVRLISPLYRQAADRVGRSLQRRGALTLPLHYGARLRTGRLHCLEGRPGAPVAYFVEQNRYFDRPHLYGPPEEDYGDNLERFSFFSLAVLASLRLIDWMPDVIHCFDWQTALIPFYLREALQAEDDLQWIATVQGIHDLTYQGIFPAEQLEVANLPEDLFHPEALEYYGQINVLKIGLLYADWLTTVSPRYARDILDARWGCGLEGVLQSRSTRLEGILNGMDDEAWNPATDERLAATYDGDDLSGKQICRRALLEELGLEARDHTPLMAYVGSLSRDKGSDLLAAALDGASDMNLRALVLGTGQAEAVRALAAVAETYPRRIAFRRAVDEDLAHRIYGGADFAIVPSRHEPCGLGQLHALRYGAVPIVHATGGLADTVRDIDASPAEGTGIHFGEPTAAALIHGLRRALALFRKRTTYRAVQRRGMAQDYSWRRTAQKYTLVYHRALGALAL